MERMAVITAATVALLAACVLLTSESAAEPISSAETLKDPWKTAPSKGAASDAQARFKANDFDGALRRWKEAENSNSDLPPAQLMMAKLYYRANMPTEGRKALEQAVVDAPDDPEAYMVLGMFAMQDGDVAKAEMMYRNANRLMSTFDKSAKRKESIRPAIYNGLAGVAEARRDWPWAQEVLEAWLRRDPANASAMQRLARCLFEQKNASGALEKLRAAAKADRDTLTPEATMAQFCQDSGDRENAEKWMKAALAAAPNDLHTRLAVGQVAFEMGQLKYAQKQAIAAMQIDPKSLEADFLRGMIALCQKDYQAAESYLESALSRSPKNISVTNDLALALVEQNDQRKRQRALELTEANMKRNPKSPVAASSYGMVLYRMGRLDDAEKALQVAAPIAVFDVDTAYVIALLSIDRGKRKEARKVLETALKCKSLSLFQREAEELLKQLQK
jgi:tetratricopeptide (TPR) repeat protein